MPIIASVSEHQPTSWPSYITDLHFAVLLAPAGLIACFKKLDDGEKVCVCVGGGAGEKEGGLVGGPQGGGREVVSKCRCVCGG